MITLADFATFEDFPQAGVLFFDISPILASPELFREACISLMPPLPISTVALFAAEGVGPNNDSRSAR